MHRFTLFVVVAGALAAGCAGSVGYSAGVSSDGYGPDLVYAAPGVQVIADYDEPIFFSDSYYWRFYGGSWYRSTYYTGGWIYATPPAPVLLIERPHAYVHYRPQGWVARRSSAQLGPAVRDHREPVRDRREDRPRFEPRQPTPQRAVPRQAPPPRGAPRPAPKDHDRNEDRDHRH